MMKADRVEVSRDEKANRWLIRIQIGDEVIRRTCHESKDADENTLRDAALKTVADEGYEIDPLNILFS
jgi:hypothetical protein